MDRFRVRDLYANAMPLEAHPDGEWVLHKEAEARTRELEALKAVEVARAERAERQVYELQRDALVHDEKVSELEAERDKERKLLEGSDAALNRATALVADSSARVEALEAALRKALAAAKYWDDRCENAWRESDDQHDDAVAEAEKLLASAQPAAPKCSTCGGRGQLSGSKADCGWMGTCPDCKGTGKAKLCPHGFEGYCKPACEWAPQPKPPHLMQPAAPAAVTLPERLEKAAERLAARNLDYESSLMRLAAARIRELEPSDERGGAPIDAVAQAVQHPRTGQQDERAGAPGCCAAPELYLMVRATEDAPGINQCRNCGATGPDYPPAAGR
jgi:hypothetical protein